MNFFRGSPLLSTRQSGMCMGQAGTDTYYNTLGTSGSLKWPGSNQKPLGLLHRSCANGQQETPASAPMPLAVLMSRLPIPWGVNSIMRWGNYDVVTGAVRWSTSEVPSAFGDTTGTPSIYCEPSPASQNVAEFLFLPGTTTTTTSSALRNRTSVGGRIRLAEPASPSSDWADVTNGDYGQCASGAYAGQR